MRLVKVGLAAVMALSACRGAATPPVTKGSASPKPASTSNERSTGASVHALPFTRTITQRWNAFCSIDSCQQPSFSDSDFLIATQQGSARVDLVLTAAFDHQTSSGDVLQVFAAYQRDGQPPNVSMAPKHGFRVSKGPTEQDTTSLTFIARNVRGGGNTYQVGFGLTPVDQDQDGHASASGGVINLVLDVTEAGLSAGAAPLSPSGP